MIKNGRTVRLCSIVVGEVEAHRVTDGRTSIMKLVNALSLDGCHDVLAFWQ